MNQDVHQMGQVDVDWQSEYPEECNKIMLESQVCCDVIFEVSGRQTIGAHRYVLMSRSHVLFQTLSRPDVDRITKFCLHDYDKEVLVIMLRYLYTGRSQLTPATVIAVLSLAKKYAIKPLTAICVAFINGIRNVENACYCLEQAHIYSEETLMTECLQFILENGNQVLNTCGFLTLCQDCVGSIISQDALRAWEITVYERVLEWAVAEAQRTMTGNDDNNLRNLIGQYFHEIRFPLISVSYFSSRIADREFLTDQEKVHIFRYFARATDDTEPFNSCPRQEIQTLANGNGDVESNSRFRRTVGPMTVTFENDADTQRKIAISFSCNASIFLNGFTLFTGSKHDYDVTVTLYTSSANLLHEETVHVADYRNNVADTTCVRLANHVYLTRGRIYTLSVVSNSPNLYYGVDGQISVPGDVTFTFYLATVPGCSSSLSQGDLPSLLYSRATQAKA